MLLFPGSLIIHPAGTNHTAPCSAETLCHPFYLCPHWFLQANDVCSGEHCFSAREKIMSPFVNNINYQWPSSPRVRVVSIKISETLNLRHLLLRAERVGWCYTTKEKHIRCLWDSLEAACLTDCKWHFLWGVNWEISMWTPAEVLTMVRLSPGPSRRRLLLCFGLGIAELNDLPSREPNLSEFSFSH